MHDQSSNLFVDVVPIENLQFFYLKIFFFNSPHKNESIDTSDVFSCVVSTGTLIFIFVITSTSALTTAHSQNKVIVIKIMLKMCSYVFDFVNKVEM